MNSIAGMPWVSLLIILAAGSAVCVAVATAVILLVVKSRN